MGKPYYFGVWGWQTIKGEQPIGKWGRGRGFWRKRRKDTHRGRVKQQNICGRRVEFIYRKKCNKKPWHIAASLCLLHQTKKKKLNGEGEERKKIESSFKSKWNTDISRSAKAPLYIRLCPSIGWSFGRADVFRCVRQDASLKEGLSVGPSVGRSVGPSCLCKKPCFLAVFAHGEILYQNK